MFDNKFAIVTQYMNGGDILSVKLCKGIKKAHAQIDEFIEDDKTMALIEPDDEYDIDPPSLREFRKDLSRNRRYELEGHAHRLVVAKTFYI